MKELGKAEMHIIEGGKTRRDPPIVPDQSRRSREQRQHFLEMLNRRHSTGHTIPDQASIYTTGEIVMVKREPFKITGVSKQGLVLRGVKGDDAYQPRAEAMTLLDAAQLIGGTMVVFYREEEPDPSQIDRWEPGQQLTVAGREYIVTGKALIVVPMATAPETPQPPGQSPTRMEDEDQPQPQPQPSPPQSPDPGDPGASPPPSESSPQP